MHEPVFAFAQHTPDTPQDEELLEGRQQVQTMGQLHLVGLRAVI